MCIRAFRARLAQSLALRRHRLSFLEVSQYQESADLDFATRATAVSTGGTDFGNRKETRGLAVSGVQGSGSRSRCLLWNRIILQGRRWLAAGR
jgi:hypothetical protein